MKLQIAFRLFGIVINTTFVIYRGRAHVRECVRRVGRVSLFPRLFIIAVVVWVYENTGKHCDPHCIICI